ncbi:MAG: hypothetical protein ABIP79_05210 [Chitinophagaceae bacterium]
MSAKFLLPHKFKKLGFCMFPLGLTGWIVAQLGWFDKFLSSLNFRFPGIQIILIFSFFTFLIGLYFIAFSKEKWEDEFISKLRLESFQFAALIQISFFIISFLYILVSGNEPANDSFLMLFFILAIFIFWLSYILKFNLSLFQNKLKNFKEGK